MKNAAIPEDKPLTNPDSASPKTADIIANQYKTVLMYKKCFHKTARE